MKILRFFSFLFICSTVGKGGGGGRGGGGRGGGGGKGLGRGFGSKCHTGSASGRVGKPSSKFYSSNMNYPGKKVLLKMSEIKENLMITVPAS